MVTKKIDLELEALISKSISSLGGNFELFGLEFDNYSDRKILRVYVDVADDSLVGCNTSSLPQRGVTIDDCARISYHLNTFLKVLPEWSSIDYFLEVSSPGVERKLLKISHFARSIGKEIRLSLSEPLVGRSNFVGVLYFVDSINNKVFVRVEDQDLCFDFNNIARANLVYRKDIIR